MFIDWLSNLSSDTLFTILMVVLALMLVVGLLKKTLWVCVMAIVVFSGVCFAENINFDEMSQSVSTAINDMFDLEDDHFDNIFGKRDNGQGSLDYDIVEGDDNSDH